MDPNPRSIFALKTAALILASTAFAHSNDKPTNMKVSNITSPGGNPSTYFAYKQYAVWMFVHVLFMIISWVFLLPVAVMLSISGSRYHRRVKLLFLLCNGIGVIIGAIYNARTPDLYQNNAHHKFGWFVTWFTLAQAALGTITRFQKLKEKYTFTPISQEAMDEHERLYSSRMDSCQLNHDSGHGTEIGTVSRSPSFSEDIELLPRQQNSGPGEKEKLSQGSKMRRLLFRLISNIHSSHFLRILELVNSAADYLILLLGFAAICTGWITYGGVFKGDGMFNGLAHFIKGGVFFWFGVLTLGRWAGCFAEIGWAWNLKTKKGNYPSAEFVESFLIFIYGVTNVFLEHLAAWGAKWTAQDLEHVSLTVMFFGGGLCGMLIESTSLRDVLNTTKEHPMVQSHASNPEKFEPPSYKVPMNPLPALVIILLGMMMSSHHQESMISTMLHSLWGNLLMGAAFARIATYLIFYLSPPKSVLPGRPPTELLSAFCFMAGGLVFMSSAGDVVQVFELYKLDVIFVFTLTVGVVTILMAWILVVIGIKGWAVRKEMASFKEECVA